LPSGCKAITLPMLNEFMVGTASKSVVTNPFDGLNVKSKLVILDINNYYLFVGVSISY